MPVSELLTKPVDALEVEALAVGRHQRSVVGEHLQGVGCGRHGSWQASGVRQGHGGFPVRNLCISTG